MSGAVALLTLSAALAGCSSKAGTPLDSLCAGPGLPIIVPWSGDRVCSDANPLDLQASGG